MAHIPIERAMQLTLERGLPAPRRTATRPAPGRPQRSSSGSDAWQPKVNMQHAASRSARRVLVAAGLAAAPRSTTASRSRGMMTKGAMPAGISPNELKKVSFDQNLDAQVPLDLPFRDETGRGVQLSAVLRPAGR